MAEAKRREEPTPLDLAALLTLLGQALLREEGRTRGMEGPAPRGTSASPTTPAATPAGTASAPPRPPGRAESP